LALAVPLSRFTSRVGGGSAFYVDMAIQCQASSRSALRKFQLNPAGDTAAYLSQRQERYDGGFKAEIRESTRHLGRRRSYQQVTVRGGAGLRL